MNMSMRNLGFAGSPIPEIYAWQDRITKKEKNEL